jgi:chromate reductase
MTSTDQSVKKKNKVFVIVGSASNNSSNQRLVEIIADRTKADFELTIFNDLKKLPHFDPELSNDNTPDSIVDFRNAIENTDAIIICTPEYIFSIPGGLKNAIEWCVATTVLSNKPTGLITASLSGKIAHEELLLIMKTVLSRYTPGTTLLIEGIKGKLDATGQLTDEKTDHALNHFIAAMKTLMESSIEN